MEDMEVLISAYADGELDGDAAGRVEAYLASAPAARRLLAIHRETTPLARAAFAGRHYIAAPSASVSGLVRRRPMGRAWRLGWAIAAPVLLAAAGFGAGTAWQKMEEAGRGRMLADLAAYHAIYSRETVHLVEVPAAQSDHLKAWLGKRVNRPIVIRDLRKAGLTFAGGRLVVLNGAPVAALMYTRDSGLPIGLCVLFHPGKPSTIVTETRGREALAAWDDGSHQFVVVGEADQDHIRGLAMAAREQL